MEEPIYLAATFPFRNYGKLNGGTAISSRINIAGEGKDYEKSLLNFVSYHVVEYCGQCKYITEGGFLFFWQV